MSAVPESWCKPPVFTEDEREAALQVELICIAVRSCRTALASPEPFTAWLRCLSRRSVCGRAGIGEASPLARFLADACGRHVRVGQRATLIGGALSDDTALARFHSAATVPLPVWAQAVEWRCQGVTAGRVLELIAEVRAAGTEGTAGGQRGTAALLPGDR